MLKNPHQYKSSTQSERTRPTCLSRNAISLVLALVIVLALLLMSTTPTLAMNTEVAETEIRSYAQSNVLTELIAGLSPLSGITNTASISGYLWVDGNGSTPTCWDGLYNNAEERLAGYTVYLYDAQEIETYRDLLKQAKEGSLQLSYDFDFPEPLDETETKANGTYTFDDLESGEYIVGVESSILYGKEYLVPTAGITEDNTFKIDWDLSDEDPPYTARAFSEPINLQADQHVTDINAGMRLPMGVQPTATYILDLSNTSTMPGGGVTGYTRSGTTLTFNTGANQHDYVIVQSSNASPSTLVTNIIFQTGVTTTVTLGSTPTNGIYMAGNVGLTASAYFTLQGNANIKLRVHEGSTNTIAGSILVPNAGGANIASITIDSTNPGSSEGTLNIVPGTTTSTTVRDAGIGGALNQPAGNITINGSTIKAESSAGGGAAIGGGGLNNGSNTHGGTITINGGTVTATANTAGTIMNAGSAGIGGGGGATTAGVSGGSGGTIVITGGTVNARGGNGGAGIGGGRASNGLGGNGGNITITGGTVTATAGQGGLDYAGGGGAGIGGATRGGNGGTITITGGTVTANAHGTRDRYEAGAGIGGGGGSDSAAYPAGSGGTILIEGGTIIATGGGAASAGAGAGIGGGGGTINNSADRTGGSGGNITITGGIIKAYGHWSGGGGGASAGIGGGGGGASASALASAGSGGPGGTITILGGEIEAIGGGGARGGAGIGGGGGASTGDTSSLPSGGSGGNIRIKDATVIATGVSSGAGIGGGAAGVGGASATSMGGASGTILIEYSNITATSTGAGTGMGGGAGIGGGGGTFLNNWRHGGSADNITITSSMVKATGAGNGAGIGGGGAALSVNNSNGGGGGVITINSGTVIATGGTNGGAGIGGGNRGNSGTMGAPSIINIDAAASVYAYSRATLPAIHTNGINQGNARYVNANVYTLGNTHTHISATEDTVLEVYAQGTTSPLLETLIMPANYRNFAYTTGAATRVDNIYATNSIITNRQAERLADLSFQLYSIYDLPDYNAHQGIAGSTNSGWLPITFDKAVIEKYVDVSGTVLLPDVQVGAPLHSTYAKSSFPAISGLIYRGYKWDSPPANSKDFTAGHVPNTVIDAARTIYFIYAIPPLDLSETTQSHPSGEYSVTGNSPAYSTQGTTLNPLTGGYMGGPTSSSNRVLTFNTAANGKMYTIIQSGSRLSPTDPFRPKQETSIFSTINIATGVNVTLVIDDIDLIGNINVQGNGNLTLLLENSGEFVATPTNRINGSILVPNDGGGNIATITIDDAIISGGTAGKLTVVGAANTSNAGIGGGLGQSGGNINILGGTVSVTGGSNAHINGGGAGIGGGGGISFGANTGGAGGTITIKNGTVSALGGTGMGHGAGIGGGGGGNGGHGGAGGNITIAGGTVTATGNTTDMTYRTSAGIGGGSAGAGGGGGIGGAGGNITIEGGTITATSGYISSSATGAGIGGGAGGNAGAGGAGGNITIKGGKVTATSGSAQGFSSGGAGIGGGGADGHGTSIGGAGGSIIIEGGEVTATSASASGTNGSSAGIGAGGANQNSGGGGAGTPATIKIDAAANVKAYSAGTVPAIHAGGTNLGDGFYVNAMLNTFLAASPRDILVYAYPDGRTTLLDTLTMPTYYTNYAYTTGTTTPRTDNNYAALGYNSTLGHNDTRLIQRVNAGAAPHNTDTKEISATNNLTSYNPWNNNAANGALPVRLRTPPRAPTVAADNITHNSADLHSSNQNLAGHVYVPNSGGFKYSTQVDGSGKLTGSIAGVSWPGGLFSTSMITASTGTVLRPNTRYYVISHFTADVDLWLDIPAGPRLFESTVIFFDTLDNPTTTIHIRQNVVTALPTGVVEPEKGYATLTGEGQSIGTSFISQMYVTSGQISVAGWSTFEVTLPEPSKVLNIKAILPMHYVLDSIVVADSAGGADLGIGALIDSSADEFWITVNIKPNARYVSGDEIIGPYYKDRIRNILGAITVP